MTYSSVVSLHLNPYTCGVARFNKSLAAALQVPLVPLSDFLVCESHGEALLSLKMEELTTTHAASLISSLESVGATFSYFAHDFTNSSLQTFLVTRARRVFANSRELTGAVEGLRSDVITVYSPGAGVQTLKAEPDVRLLTAGMAHKLRTEDYRALSKLLSSDPRTVRLEITTAIHEGQQFDEGLFSVSKGIQDVFEHEIHFCGFLSDEELSRRLQECDAYVAFFPRGVRENNTTVLSAMAHGCAVITNLDSFSPSWMVHGRTIFDISLLSGLPSGDELKRVGEAAKAVSSGYNFVNLANIILKS